MARKEKLVTVYEVMFHVADDHPQAHGGNAGDGSFCFRTGSKRDADAFAKTHDYYGKPCEVHKSELPPRIANRYGVF